MFKAYKCYWQNAFKYKARSTQADFGRPVLVNFIIFVLVGIWLGLYLSFVTDWPVSFFITVIEALFYGAAIVKERMSASRL